jgi:hypothetical protein
MTLVVRNATGDEKARELATRLSARAPDLHCSACGHQDFAILEQPKAGARTMLWRHMVGGQIEDAPISQPLVSLLCTNCGHIEQFAEAVLNGASPEQYGEPIIDG